MVMCLSFDFVLPLFFAFCFLGAAVVAVMLQDRVVLVYL